MVLQTKRPVASDSVEDNPPGSQRPPNSALSDPQEDTFWTTPGDRSAINFKDEQLINEDVDLSDVTSSFSTPVVPFKPSVARVAPSYATVYEEEQCPTEEPEDSSALDNTFDLTTVAHDSNTENVERANDHPLPQTTGEPSPGVDLGQSDISSMGDRTPRAHSAKKIRVTGDVERIVVCHDKGCARCFVSDPTQSKIWASVGDLIMPGNHFSTSGTSGARPPHAKETMYDYGHFLRSDLSSFIAQCAPAHFGLTGPPSRLAHRVFPFECRSIVGTIPDRPTGAYCTFTARPSRIRTELRSPAS